MDVKKTVIKQYNGSDYDNIIPTAKTNNVLMQNNNIGVNNVDKCMDYLSNNISQTGRLYTPNNTRIPYIELYNPVSGARYVFSYKFNTSSVTTSPFSFNIIQTNGTEAIITDSIYVDVIYHKGYIYYCKAIPSSNYIGRTDAERLLGFSKVRIILYKVSASYNSISDIFDNATKISEYTTYMTTKDMSYLRRSIRLIPCGNGVGLVISSTRIFQISDYSDYSDYYNISSSIYIYNINNNTSEEKYSNSSTLTTNKNITDIELFTRNYCPLLGIAKLRAGIYIVYSVATSRHNVINGKYLMIFTSHNIIVFEKKFIASTVLKLLEPDSTSNLIFCYYLDSYTITRRHLSISYYDNYSDGQELFCLSYENNSPYSNAIMKSGIVESFNTKIILKKSRNYYIMTNIAQGNNYTLYYKKIPNSAILNNPGYGTSPIELKDNNDNSFSAYYPYVVDTNDNSFWINNIIYSNEAENKSCSVPIRI